MLALDTSKKLSFSKLIASGDLVIVYERHETMKAVKVCEGSVFQNRFGMFKHSHWIGLPFGSKVYSNKSGYVYLLAPSPELWTLVLSHRTQILYIADISFVIMYLEIVPGCLVLESGTGSGSLTTSLVRAVAPTGHVHTFDFHEQRAASAREDFERTGVSSMVTVGVRDIQGKGFPDELCGLADAVFLDLPQPWLVIVSAAKMLKPDATLCSFSPCIEQVQRSCEALRTNFTDIRTFEVLLRTYEVREVKINSMRGQGGSPCQQPPCKRRHTNEGSDKQESVSSAIMARPSAEARGHTGYLTFARLRCSA
ncbi:tRNA (adenine(58)-N(1))-methyltransferase catalytic subunit TRMT61A-like [Rhodamnia argentea]|uniref:tRNA (adenine(58)-N(1))-methyltransferase n=1 Tax=Rhodamnia argentea TaxID=178133 RepID=A0ABM3HQ16_9MYRT|nr:tRNA (adenine(58)-N(1))-methyltransferase catalytic subunit TRMT61A-like [Rhodamnia argentea]XP_048138687.1 tRNA (adenine(58)-N(1))-methyltransferase catalytic subunit TRMT61A-like [Rhodamnia argentea]XP_048138688.1 tRNA (adenine(58)-N(1))-methyltransferase catalytic subunit TRMT61A-like [Rhodamnia argentea]